MKNKISLTLLLFVTVSVFAGSPKIIATTSWTKAFAELAGAEDIVLLAPMGMQHPPEYEVTIKELQMIGTADFMIFAGYEAMIPRVKESIGEKSTVELIQITTTNDYATISESVLKIANIIGTLDVAKENLQIINTFFNEWKKELVGKDTTNIPVHFHQQKLLRGLGIAPALVYGPAAPTLGDIKKVLGLKPTLIVDNIHSPKAGVFMEIEPAPTAISWINFPGIKGTKSMLDVLTYNRSELTKVLK